MKKGNLLTKFNHTKTKQQDLPLVSCVFGVSILTCLEASADFGLTGVAHRNLGFILTLVFALFSLLTPLNLVLAGVCFLIGTTELVDFNGIFGRIKLVLPES